ncbi:unnamed protein product, partial [Rotaria magnacalcarata]
MSILYNGILLGPTVIIEDSDFRPNKIKNTAEEHYFRLELLW